MNARHRISAREPRVVLAAATCGMFLMTGWLAARERCGCAVCGAEECNRVCRLVAEDRKITTTCWGVREEPFCVPGPSCRGETQCEEVCGDCGEKSGVFSRPRLWSWTLWGPGGEGRIFTRCKLMKKTVTKKVPGYKWVVEDLCPKCVAAMETPELPAGTTPPPLPSLDRDTHVVPVAGALDSASARN